MQRELAKLNNHYIICGAGRVGRTVAREFRSHGVPFVFIETNEQRAQWAQNEGMAVVVGSATREEVLHEARISHAQGLVAAVASDADNLYIVLTARGMKPDLRIVARASEEEALPKFKRAGATHVVSPYHFVGRRIARLFLRPHVLELIDNAFGSERLDMEIEEVPVAEKSALAGKTLADAEIRQKTGVMVLAVKLGDGRMHFNPAPDVVVHPGDCLIAIGSATHLEKLASLANS
jgi:voltage-gated potassium channel